MADITITQILKDPDTFLKEDNCWGFYDWFCSTKALERKAKFLLAKFSLIANSKKINQDTMYLWFKNNCPINGSLYDDFRISDIKTSNVIFTVTPKSGFTADEGRAEVWGIENKFEKPILTGTWQDVINWFNS